jgi:hypothetical protein
MSELNQSSKSSPVCAMSFWSQGSANNDLLVTEFFLGPPFLLKRVEVNKKSWGGHNGVGPKPAHGRGAGGDLIGLPSRSWPGRPPEELGWIDLQNGCQPLDDLQPHVSYGSLDPAQVCPVHPGVVGQLLLGNLPIVPDAS